MDENACDIVVAGHICLDIIPDLHGCEGFLDRLIPGKLINIGKAIVSTGGPVSNTGLALQKLGIKTAFMGKIGRDLFGEAVLSLLAEYGADKTMTVVDGEDTSYTIVIAPLGIDRMYLHNPSVNNTFGHCDVNFDIVAGTRHFHLGYPPLMQKLYADGGKELIETFRLAKQAGVTTSLDMVVPDPTSEAGQVDWSAVLAELLPYVDVFVPSVEETLFMIHRDRFLARKDQAGANDMLDVITVDDTVELGDRLLEMGAKIVLLKAGRFGVYLRTAGEDRLAGLGRARPNDAANWSDRQLWEPSFQVEKVASATGSGDSAIAGFLAAYLKGASAEQSIKYACAVGGHNVQAFDAVSGIRSWDQTTEAIVGWAKNDMAIEVAGWHHDDKGQFWVGPADSILAD